jgi:DNA recombination protein RmuC
MDPFLIVLLVAMVALAVAAWLAASSRRDLHAVRTQLDEERRTSQTAQSASAAAAARTLAAEQRRDELAAERDTAIRQREEESVRRVDAERAAALDRQSVAAMEKRMADWETAHRQAIEAAKAATLEAGAQLSSKLMEDHKREAEAARVAADEKSRATNADLVASVQKVQDFAAGLKEQFAVTQLDIAKVNRALSNPSGAGQLGEMVLENSLKAHGLERDRDFVLQQTAGDRGLRPDALVFLPGDAVMVIDSKSSRFLVEMAEATDEASLAAARAKLAKTMNDHLKALAGKEYDKAVRDDYRRNGRGTPRVIINALFVPTDGALEHLRVADSGFFVRAADCAILPVGPGGLASLLTIARLQIEVGRRAENHERIVEAVEKLAESVVVALNHMAKIGTGLRSAADGYEALAGSVEARVTPRLKTLGALGVGTGKPPKSLPHFRIVEIESAAIEGSAETVADSLPPPGRS